MKKAILFLFAIMLCIEEADAQTFQSAMPVVMSHTGYVQAEMNNTYGSHRVNKKALIGGIVAGSGLMIAAAGGTLFLLNVGGGSDYDEPNTSQQNLAEGLIIAGGVLVVAGSVVGIIGVCVAAQYSNNICAPGFCRRFRLQ